LPETGGTYKEDAVILSFLESSHLQSEESSLR